MTFEHFENLWVAAEETSAKAPNSKPEILAKLSQAFEEYAKLDHIPSKDIQNVLKTKKMGEILFKMAELSRIDNVNTFAALELEVIALSDSGNLSSR